MKTIRRNQIIVDPKILRIVQKNVNFLGEILCFLKCLENLDPMGSGIPGSQWDPDPEISKGLKGETVLI